MPDGDEAAVVDDRDEVGEAVGLVEVLRREQDVGPARGQCLDREPELVAAPRVEAGRRLVHEQEPRRADEAGTEVETALHAAGVGAHESVAGLGEPELLEHLVGRGVAGAAVVTEEARDHAEVLAAR